MQTLRTVAAWLVAVGLASQPAVACSLGVAGAKCLTPPVSSKTERSLVHDVGGILPRGEFMAVIGTNRYGLPPARDGSMYFNVEGRALRVDAETMEILEDSTRYLRRALP